MGEIAQMTRGAVKKAAENTVGKDGSRLKDPKGLAAAGVGMAVLPFAVEQLAKRLAPKVSEVASDLGDQAKQTAKDAAKEKLSPGNLVQGLTGGGDGDGSQGGGLLSSLKPGGSGDGDGDGGQSGQGGGLLSKLKPGGSGDGEGEKGRAAPGYGSGRRMPIQQGISVAVPIKTAYNAWTGFEDWPKFMHRLESAEQVDEATVALTSKIWGISRRFEAKITEQRPDQRIEWNVEQGLSHTGVVTFHKLAERLTRIELDLDLEPHGIIEKAARGMRFAKRAVRGDLHRFKAYVELYEDEIEEGWRGTIVDGDVKRKTDRPSRRSGSRSRSRNGSSSSSRGRSSSSSSRGRSSSGSSRGRSKSSSSRGRSSSSSSRGRSSSSSSRRKTGSRSRSRS